MQYDLILISLVSLYAAALLGPPLPGPHILTQRPCLNLRCQALLTYLLACVLRCTALTDFSILICFFLFPKNRSFSRSLCCRYSCRASVAFVHVFIIRRDLKRKMWDVRTATWQRWIFAGNPRSTFIMCTLQSGRFCGRLLS